MPLFERMREMAKLQAEQRLHFDRATASAEDKIAFRRLGQIEDEICGGSGEQGGAYRQVLQCIERDRRLALEGWEKDRNGGLMYHKIFDSPGQLRQARELLAMVNFANGNPQEKLRQTVQDGPPPAENPKAVKLSMPREWYEAYMRVEGMDALAK